MIKIENELLQDVHCDARIDRLLTVASLSILFGVIASALLVWWQPFSDSIDIIGLPLLLGYSEATERQTATLFVIASFFAAFLFDRIIIQLDRWNAKKWCDRVYAILGTAGLAFWSTLPFWGHIHWITGIWALGLILAVVIARYLPRVSSLPTLWGVGISLGIAAFVTGQLFVGPESPSLTVMVVALIVAIMVEGRWGTRISGEVTGQAMAQVASIYSVILLYAGNQTIAVFVGLSAFAFLSCRVTRVWSIEDRLLFILIFSVGLIAIPQPLGFDVIQSLALGVFLGWMIEFAFGEWIEQSSLADPVTRMSSLFIVCAALLLANSFFYSVWLLGASLIIMCISQLRNQTVQLALSVILLASCFLYLDPHSPRNAVDPLHDGQIVSAVWQWKQGQTLFEQVFPLRLTDFLYFAAIDPWVGESHANYVAAGQVLDFVGPVGVFAIIWAMTGSISWSWVTALVVGASFPFDYRAGSCMVLLGMAAYLFRTLSASVLLLSFIGAASLWMGYDACGTVMGAIGAAILIPAGGEPIGRALRKNMVTLSLFAFLSIAIFSATLGIWQGGQAVQTYFILFVEYANEYPAFYGYPAFRKFSELQTTLFPIAILFGTGIASIVSLWRGMSLTCRRHMIMLMASLLVFAQRALARSDLPHLKTLWYPIAVFALIGLYWLLQFAKRNEWRLHRIVPVVEIMFLAISLHFYRGPFVPLSTWFEKSKSESFAEWPTARVDIADRLSPGDSVWEIQNGMWPFIYHHVNPTRHVLAYCMGWPREANRALRAMAMHPPKVVAFRPALGIDHISSVLWNPVITQFLYEHYRPVLNNDFLEQSPTRWRGWSQEYEDYSVSFKLRELPARWGRSLEHFTPRMKKQQVIQTLSMAVLEDESLAVTLHLEHVPTPRDHLLVQLNDTTAGSSDSVITVRFSGQDELFDEASRIVFHGRPGSSKYLVPIGLSPAWSWRNRIGAIKISIEAPAAFTIEHAELWELQPAE